MRRRVKHERQLYLNRFAELGCSLPGEDEIRQTLFRRFPKLAGKSKGQLNILAVFHDYNWEKGALLPALEKFGTVIHYDWLEHHSRQPKEWFTILRERMNADLVNRITHWHRHTPIDLIFCYLSGEQVTPRDMEHLRSFKIPLINISLNDKENFIGKIRKGNALGIRDICRHFDLCWTSTRDALEKYTVEGALAVYLPEGANPELHRPYDLSMEFDVSFVGQCYGQRPIYLQRLKEAGIDVVAYGNGWPNGPLSTDEMVRMYSRSKINVGFAAVSDMTDAFCLKGRDFEVPMSGGLYLTQYHPELEACYMLGHEIETYKDPMELVDKVRFLLDHPDNASSMRRKGYQRAHAEHTWEMRFEKIFSHFGVKIELPDNNMDEKKIE